MTTPIFILSLPRSGSTLFQKVLLCNDDIAVTSEPWLLLPLVYSLRQRNVVSEYNHFSLGTAMTDFVCSLSNGIDEYYDNCRDFALSLYTSAAKGKKYFVDKTPRYTLILDELFKIFYDAKFIILWRNPLAIISSMINTWGNGHWNIFRYDADLFKGLKALIDFSEKEKKNILTVKYEDLVIDTATVVNRISMFLELDFSLEKVSSCCGMNIPGRLGDTSGQLKYSDISHQSIDIWKKTINNYFRVQWCKNYLNSLGNIRLASMGYDYRELISDLNMQPKIKLGIAEDLMIASAGRVFSYFRKYIFEYRFKRNKI